jgi:23S rRNA (uracil1939-C5)-methyltransferase
MLHWGPGSGGATFSFMSVVFELMVLAPPRSGTADRIMRKVIAAARMRIGYFPCNPTTLTPDLGDPVGAGYAIRAVQPLDLFPHTYHVECVARLERCAPAS